MILEEQLNGKTFGVTFIRSSQVHPNDIILTTSGLHDATAALVDVGIEPMTGTTFIDQYEKRLTRSFDPLVMKLAQV